MHIVAPDWEVERDDLGPPARPPRRPWRAVGGVVAVLVLATVVFSSLGSDTDPRRPEPGELAGADERRLPARVDPLWSITLAGSGNALASSMIVDGRDVVVAVVDDGSRDRSMITGIDASTGGVRWRRSFSFSPPEASLLGVLDGVVLVAQRDLSSQRLIGLATVDGATLWERETDGAVDVVLLGTSVVTELSGGLDARLTVLDPRSGEVLGDLAGELLTTDLAGTWYVGQTDRIVAIDLADGWNEPVTVFEGDTGAFAGMAVVDDRFLVADSFGAVAELVGGRTSDLAGGLDVPRIEAMFPAGGSSFVGLNASEMFGVELIGGRLRQTWNRDATLRSFTLTEQGLVMAIDDSGAGLIDGAETIIVDGVTGERLAGAGAGDGDDAFALIVGDGFVAVSETVEGTERVGYDLSGTQIWRLPVSGRVRVGNELVVVMTNTPSGYELRAFGAGG